MKLYTFEHRGTQRLGVERDNRLLDLTAAEGGSPLRHPDMLSFIRAGDEAFAAARAAIAGANDSFSHDFCPPLLFSPTCSQIPLLVLLLIVWRDVLLLR